MPPGVLGSAAALEMQLRRSPAPPPHERAHRTATHGTALTVATRGCIASTAKGAVRTTPPATATRAPEELY